MELDLIDRKILYYLDNDSRQNISQLAKKLRIGRNVILYRINKLKEKGIIKGSFAEINNPLLGYFSFRIFLRLGNSTKEKKDDLFEFISKNPNVMWLSKVIGKWDLDVIMMTKNISEFENFRKNLFLEYNEIIDESKISLLTKIYYYPKDYLIYNKRSLIEPTILDINTKINYKPNEKDEEILYELTKDATINIVDLSRKLKLSINTLKKRIKNLEKNKIILGYRLFIDPQKIGYEYYKLHLSLKNYNKNDLKSLGDWLGSKPSIVYINNHINGEDFEIELHLKNESEYLLFLEELNKGYGRLIKESFVLKFYDLKIWRYLPLK